ncbi:MAG TPA: PEGA domain-containing protein [bacterium (Candidatus Stahlbacteria)]|nr:PEGA domain-containing protein [Candidatus Stahlbacteria bacterium]
MHLYRIVCQVLINNRNKIIIFCVVTAVLLIITGGIVFTGKYSNVDRLNQERSFTKRVDLSKESDFDKCVSKFAEEISKEIIKHKKKRIAVVDFIRERKGNPGPFGRFLSEVLGLQLSHIRGFTVLEKSDLKQILDNVGIEMTGLYDPITVKKCNFKGTDALVIGSYWTENVRVRVIARLVDAGTAETLSSIQVFIPRKHIPKKYSPFQDFIIVETEPPKYILFVTSEPKDAKVFVDGVLRGRTPIEINLPKAGEYELEVKKYDYESVKLRVKVTADYKTRIRAVLSPLSESLKHKITIWSKQSIVKKDEIVPFQGCGGIKLGASVVDVVSAWGKPHREKGTNKSDDRICAIILDHYYVLPSCEGGGYPTLRLRYFSTKWDDYLAYYNIKPLILKPIYKFFDDISYEDLINAFGKPDKYEEGTYFYYLEDRYMYFSLRSDGSISAIGLCLKTGIFRRIDKL